MATATVVCSGTPADVSRIRCALRRKDYEFVNVYSLAREFYIELTGVPEGVDVALVVPSPHIQLEVYLYQ